VIVETSRLLLRPISLDDLDGLVALHSDPEVTRFIRALSREQAISRLGLAAEEWSERGYGLMAILERSSGRFLGRTGLRFWPQFEETEIGWALRRDAWGQGYASEAASACLGWALRSLSLPYLTAMIDPANVASTRLALRLGMTPLREDVLLGDAVIVHWIETASADAGLDACTPRFHLGLQL
jgi:RimJ/RimL family protein N-acetyltransferase